jgi:hypothetical protein
VCECLYLCVYECVCVCVCVLTPWRVTLTWGCGVARRGQAKDVDAITACFANAFAGAGGLCAGPLPIVDHQARAPTDLPCTRWSDHIVGVCGVGGGPQRLSGQGYCYSASMPALLAATGLESLHMLQAHPAWTDKLRSNAALFRQAFGQVRRSYPSTVPRRLCAHAQGV